MGKISEKGIMKEGHINPAQPAKTRFDLIISDLKKKAIFLIKIHPLNSKKFYYFLMIDFTFQIKNRNIVKKRDFPQSAILFI